MVGCHYTPWGLQLPFLLLTGIRLYAWWWRNMCVNNMSRVVTWKCNDWVGPVISQLQVRSAKNYTITAHGTTNNSKKIRMCNRQMDSTDTAIRTLFTQRTNNWQTIIIKKHPCEAILQHTDFLQLYVGLKFSTLNTKLKWQLDMYTNVYNDPTNSVKRLKALKAKGPKD